MLGDSLQNTLVILLGFKGGALLALSGLPQAIKSIREGKTGDISRALLWMWVIGEWDMLAFTLLTTPSSYPLILNFGCNSVLVSIITWYYYFPRASTKLRAQPRFCKFMSSRVQHTKLYAPTRIRLVRPMIGF